ncbi:hypothetical protein MIR68_001906 [Amoeboaphelidium protococcarum]|nr:hypothetical protein MIR68_001906 [Amoeboaphelidium protococcarum]
MLVWFTILLIQLQLVSAVQNDIWAYAGDHQLLTLQGHFDQLYSNVDERRRCEYLIGDLISLQPSGMTAPTTLIDYDDFSLASGMSFQLDMSRYIVKIATHSNGHQDVTSALQCLKPLFGVNTLTLGGNAIQITSYRFVGEQYDRNAPGYYDIGGTLYLLLTQVVSQNDMGQMVWDHQPVLSYQLLDLLPSDFIINKLPDSVVYLVDPVYIVALLTRIQETRQKEFVAALSKTLIYSAIRRKELIFNKLVDGILRKIPAFDFALQISFCIQFIIQIENEKSNLMAVLATTSALSRVYSYFKDYPSFDCKYKSDMILKRMTSAEVPSYVGQAFKMLIEKQFTLDNDGDHFLVEVFSAMSERDLVVNFKQPYGRQQVYNQLPLIKQVTIARNYRVPNQWVSDDAFKLLLYGERFQLLVRSFVKNEDFDLAMSNVIVEFENRLQNGEFDDSLVSLLRRRFFYSENYTDGNVSLNKKSLSAQIKYCALEISKPNNWAAPHYCHLLERIKALDNVG